MLWVLTYILHMFVSDLEQFDPQNLFHEHFLKGIVDVFGLCFSFDAMPASTLHCIYASLSLWNILFLAILFITLRWSKY